jgi:hypothetical protein
MRRQPEPSSILAAILLPFRPGAPLNHEEIRMTAREQALIKVLGVCLVIYVIHLITL